MSRIVFQYKLLSRQAYIPEKPFRDLNTLYSATAECHEVGLGIVTAAFLERWSAAVSQWEERARPLAGSRVVCHHKSWVYLEDWLGLREVATLEPVPGIPPTAAHLSALLAELGTGGDGADMIIRSPFQSPKPSEWLQERTGIPAVMLPLTVGGSDRARDLFSLFDDVIDRLLAARAGTPQ